MLTNIVIYYYFVLFVVLLGLVSQNRAIQLILLFFLTLGGVLVSLSRDMDYGDTSAYIEYYQYAYSYLKFEPAFCSVKYWQIRSTIFIRSLISSISLIYLV